MANFSKRTPPALGNGTRHMLGRYHAHGNGGFPVGRVGLTKKPPVFTGSADTFQRHSTIGNR